MDVYQLRSEATTHHRQRRRGERRGMSDLGWFMLFGMVGMICMAVIAVFA